MIRLFKLTPRQLLIVLHDLIVTALAIVLTFFMRFEGPALEQRIDELPSWLPGFVFLAGFVFFFMKLNEAKWRFTSLPELMLIVRASTVLALILLVSDYILLTPSLLGAYYFGKITIALYWLVQIVCLAGPRIVYRYLRDVRTQMHARDESSIATLILGHAADAEVPLRGIESGAIRKIRPIGILSPSRSDLGVTVRGVPVMGGFDDLEQVIGLLRERKVPVSRLLLTTSAFEVESSAESILMRARRSGISVSRLPSLTEGPDALRLSPVAVEDLLLRPSVNIDYRRLEQFVRGKCVVVTGGGGSIGSEICDRIVTFSAARLLIIENSEPALHAVLEQLSLKEGATRVEGRLADIRDRECIYRLFQEFKPDVVYHAAALKHVPLLERDWSEGLKTNVFGSVNVADAAMAAGAAGMVMISTDKAIEPVSVLGMTKRFAEMYCQALDAEFRGESKTRFIAVRFGNVLASNGSVVPKFKAQIEAGGPVTVTHPDMVRYFMTIREACDLVVSAASHALGPQASDDAVYVLNMGQPVRILELAEHMIRLSGLQPHRDIEITFTGIRPGERLKELLFSQHETDTEIGIEGIIAAKPSHPTLAIMRQWLVELEKALADHNRLAADQVLGEAIPDYARKHEMNSAASGSALAASK